MNSSLTRRYKKSALVEVVQSRQELHQVRQATAMALTGTWAVEVGVQKNSGELFCLRPSFLQTVNFDEVVNWCLK